MSTCLQSAQTKANCYSICALDYCRNLRTPRCCFESTRDNKLRNLNFLSKGRGYNYPRYNIKELVTPER